ncbi:MAG: Hsp70 family protein [Cyanobacteria bacterium P01_D01_bin.36]
MYAIDFGTSNTVVTRWSEANQSPETIVLSGLSSQIKGNPPLVPSLLYVESAASEIDKTKALVGQTVRDRGLDVANDPRFFRNFKRGIGTQVQGFMPELDDHSLSFEQVGSCFLHQVIRQLKAQHDDVNSLVFTVPVDSFEAYRLWLGKVCESLDVEQVRLIDEPTAAALGYELSPEDKTLLVIDFGGGTLDFSLVQPTFEKAKPVGYALKWGRKRSGQNKSINSQANLKTVRVLAKAGENLGGADIDRWIVEHFAQSQDLPITSLTLRLAEKLKIALSGAAATETCQEAYFDEETLDSYEIGLTRDRFEQILTEQGFFDRLDNRLAQVMQQAQRQNITSADIDAVLLVGGSAQIPAVQSWAKRNFEAHKVHGDRPFEAVAQGALRLPNLELQDFLYHSYGIRYWDRRNNAHGWHPIIPQGQPYPTTEPVEFFLGASSENQPSIELILGELGEVAPAQTEIYFEGDQLVTRQADSGGAPTVQPLNDREGARSIATLTPPGFPGSDRIRISFSIDAERFLRMTVEDLLTSETLLSNQVVVQLS